MGALAISYGNGFMIISKTQEGFTLIEILVAVVIMGLAYVAILQSFSLSGRNIVKMETTRTTLFENSLAFEQQLLTIGKMDQGQVGSVNDVLVEGNRYRLILVSDENDDFMTLKLEKK